MRKKVYPLHGDLASAGPMRAMGSRFDGIHRVRLDDPLHRS
jgi:hypothetical protein